MATSKKQLQANRRNALKSTGPKTPEGKRASSLNAIKHGLSAQPIILPWEDVEEFEAFAQRIRKDLVPEDSVEEEMVAKIIELGWKMRRGNRSEMAAIQYAAEKDSGEGMWDPKIRGWRRDMAILGHREAEPFLRHQTNIENRFYKAVNQFWAYRANRQATAESRKERKADRPSDRKVRANRAPLTLDSTQDKQKGGA